MARTTDADIEAIMEVDPTLAPTLASYITPANLIVTRHCLGGDLSEEELKEIETHLAAHFYAAHRDMRRTSESLGGEIQTAFQHREDLGFDATHYGQTAMRLDATGKLAIVNAQMKKSLAGSTNPLQKVGLTWLGTHRDADGNEVL